MKIIKKINNNVAEAIDGNGNHLIAFGKGLGFPKTPYELTDLNKITMTFYKLSEYFEGLLKEIPEEILNLSAEIVSMAQEDLNGQLNPTLVFSLADHIQFSIQRLTTYKNVRMNYSYEIAQMYQRRAFWRKRPSK
ncbi:MAG: CAT RNA binding domain-containing protein [Enterococcus sp.]|uniref:CAT RNA binding domain-containing protein n=1 Tax=Enterococcus sp. TaxID=35783 RepID=UPI0039936265